MSKKETGLFGPVSIASAKMRLHPGTAQLAQRFRGRDRLYISRQQNFKGARVQTAWLEQLMGQP